MGEGVKPLACPMGKAIAIIILIVLVLIVLAIYLKLQERKRRPSSAWELQENYRNGRLWIEAERNAQTVQLAEPIDIDDEDFNGRLFEARLEADEKLLALNDRKGR